MTSDEQQQDYPATDPGAGQTGAPAPEPPPQYQYAPPGPPRTKWSRETSTAFDPRRKNVALACILSCMPGLGQIYVGFYQRGFIHAIVVASIIAFLNARPPVELVPFFGMILPFFWLYNIVDAGRRAALFNRSLAGTSEVELPGDLPSPGIGGSVVGGAVLVGLGALMLLHTRFDMSMEWLREWWPLLPILFGVYLLVKGMAKKSDSAG